MPEIDPRAIALVHHDDPDAYLFQYGVTHWGWRPPAPTPDEGPVPGWVLVGIAPDDSDLRLTNFDDRTAPDPLAETRVQGAQAWAAGIIGRATPFKVTGWYADADDMWRPLLVRPKTTLVFELVNGGSFKQDYDTRDVTHVLDRLTVPGGLITIEHPVDSADQRAGKSHRTHIPVDKILYVDDRTADVVVWTGARP